MAYKHHNKCLNISDTQLLSQLAMAIFFSSSLLMVIMVKTNFKMKCPMVPIVPK